MSAQVIGASSLKLGPCTREQFERWLRQHRVHIALDGPYDIEPCACRDVNCHGWRLVPRPEQPGV